MCFCLCPAAMVGQNTAARRLLLLIFPPFQAGPVRRFCTPGSTTSGSSGSLRAAGSTLRFRLRLRIYLLTLPFYLLSNSFFMGCYEVILYFLIFPSGCAISQLNLRRWCYDHAKRTHFPAKPPTSPRPTPSLLPGAIYHASREIHEVR